MHPLDNPVWSALSTAQRVISTGNDLARRFSPDVSPFAGIANPRLDEGWLALAEQVAPDEIIGFFAIPADAPIAAWQVESRFPLIQMQCDRTAYRGHAANDSATLVDQGLSIRQLTLDDGPAMVELAALTQPGPMKARTVTLGRYRGIFNAESALVAMAGERMRVDGMTEVSGVCTHPDYRGRSLARLLVADVTETILEQGCDAFLHVRGGNDGAARVYEKLGYTVRQVFENVTLKLKA